MPTYEYKCDACGHAFEKFQSITAEPIRKCPQCGKQKVRRLIGTGAGLIFKGSGFYLTDYRDASYKEKAKAESGAGSSSGETKPATGGDSKSDSKPAESAPPAAAAPAGESAASTPAPAGNKGEPRSPKPAKAEKKPKG